jgi:hypothetical protein
MDPEVGRVLVFHNGVIDIRTKPQESDTEVFVRDVLAVLPSRWWEQPVLRYLVNAAIDWSKLVIMTAEETVNLHESRGEWDGGLWYSSSHKPSTWSSTAHSGAYGHWDNDAQKWVSADDHKGTTVVTPRNSAIIPYRTTAAAHSAAALGLLDSAKPDEIDPHADSVIGLRSGGHSLTAIKSMSLLYDGEYEDSVICDECRTIGSVYVIDGDYYVDMAHLTGDTDDEDNDHEGLLSPVTLRAHA